MKIMSLNENTINDWYEYFCIPSNWSSLSRTDVINKFVDVLQSESVFVRKNFNCRLNVSYGERDREKIDFIFPKGVNENQSGLPIVVFLHGGYWEEGNPSFYNGFAKPYINENCVVAIIGYDLSSETIKIPFIEAQCVKALEFIIARYPSLKIILSGHSAGAYLASAMFSHQHLVKSIHALFPLAGCFCLEDLAKTSISKALDFNNLGNQDLLQRNFFFDKNNKVFMFAGQNDSPYLLMQSLKFFEKLTKEGHNVNFEIIRNEDHFSLIENSILKMDFPITKCIIGLIKELNDPGTQ